jgi:hypothetical protein
MMIRFALILLFLFPLSALADISGPPAPDPVVEPAPPEVVVAPLAPDAGKVEATTHDASAPAPAVQPAAEKAGWEPATSIPTTTEVMKTATEAIALGAAAFDKPTLVSAAAFVSALLWALLAALRRWGGVVSVWLTGQRIRWITLIAAPIATWAGSMGTGVGWLDALIMSFSGPGALLLNEFGRAFKGGTDG